MKVKSSCSNSLTDHQPTMPQQVSPYTVCSPLWEHSKPIVPLYSKHMYVIIHAIAGVAFITKIFFFIFFVLLCFFTIYIITEY
jgi:hypothetical protein